MELLIVPNLVVFALLVAWLARSRARGTRFAVRVLVALLLGIAAGGVLQAVYGHGHAVVAGTLEWVNLVGGGYVRLLQMIVMPLVLVSILSAVTRLENASGLGRISVAVLGLLMLTTALSAAVGIGVTRLFGLSAEGLVQGVRELERGAFLEGRAGQVTGQSVPQILLSLIPTNFFSDLTGGPASIVGVVIFAALLGVAALALKRERPEVGQQVVDAIEVGRRWVMGLVKIVIRLTPYGVLALMTRMTATSRVEDILALASFVVASYLGLALILGLHAGLLTLSGISPLRYFQRAAPVLAFAFTSRSSAAAIPLNIETQVRGLGVPPSIAGFSAGFGATIGQNGCAGLYPAMLAVMIAPSVGIDPTSLPFLLSVVGAATLGSFGIAGVGGGATFAAIIVLSMLGLPIALAGLMISIEPLIDMGRTAVNVSGSMTAGAVTSRLLGEVEPPAPEPDEGRAPVLGRPAAGVEEALRGPAPVGAVASPRPESAPGSA